ncbi:hypothetical protein GCM10025856_22520 [Methylophaga marina]|nr:hypothetical protein GCM10025856_22520 [Methylophaga marina]
MTISRHVAVMVDAHVVEAVAVVLLALKIHHLRIITQLKLRKATLLHRRHLRLMAMPFLSLSQK